MYVCMYVVFKPEARPLLGLSPNIKWKNILKQASSDLMKYVSGLNGKSGSFSPSPPLCSMYKVKHVF